MTGPFVPVGILNPIRAVVGIPRHRFNLSVKCSRARRKVTERVGRGCAQKQPASRGASRHDTAPQD
jgi:hypothetical protein